MQLYQELTKEMTGKLLEQIAEITGSDQVVSGEPMAKHTTFRTGGPCSIFVSPSDVNQIRAVIDICKKESVPWYVIGNGSNLLVSDQGYQGVMIHLGSTFSKVEMDKENGTVTVQAGAALGGLVRSVSKNGLGDMTWAAGIPGSFGGAVVMNAGAYGGEMKDAVISVTASDLFGNIREFSAEELDFGYRHSLFSGGGYIILSAKLKLSPGNTDEISAKMAELTAKRKEKQPLEYRSAGSTFKRPEGTFAALLIEECGLKGYSCGDAEVSVKHSGFVINKGTASFEDVMNVIEHVKKTVYEKRGISLECEPEIIRRG